MTFRPTAIALSVAAALALYGCAGVTKKSGSKVEAEKICQDYVDLVKDQANARQFRRAKAEAQTINCPAKKDRAFTYIVYAYLDLASDMRHKQKFIRCAKALGSAAGAADNIADIPLRARLFQKIGQQREWLDDAIERADR